MVVADAVAVADVVVVVVVVAVSYSLMNPKTDSHHCWLPVLPLFVFFSAWLPSLGSAQNTLAETTPACLLVCSLVCSLVCPFDL